MLKHNTWRSVAGSIDELKGVADYLGEEGSQAARRLKERILLAVPRFEASEEVCTPSNKLSLYIDVKTHYRNGNDAIIAMPAKHNSPGRNPASPCTRDVREVSG